MLELGSESGLGPNAVGSEYSVQFSQHSGLVDFTRLAIKNTRTGFNEVIDMRMGEQLGRVGNAIDVFYHGGAHKASITGQVEPTLTAEKVTGFKTTAPTALLARALVTSLSGTEYRPITSILSEGTERIASHRYDSESDGAPIVGGMVGTPYYAGQSLERAVSSSVPVMLPRDINQRASYFGLIQQSLAQGRLGFEYFGYALKPSASLPRLIHGPFDVRETVIDSQDGINYVERTSYNSVGVKLVDGRWVVGAKEYKHGQAAVGEKREEALLIGRNGQVLSPGAFNLDLQKSGGVWQAGPGFNPYVNMQMYFPWQQRADAEGRGDAPAKRVLAGLTFIPAAMPFGSGASMVDTSMYNEIAGFAVPQIASIPLSNAANAGALRKADFSGLNVAGGTNVQAGRGFHSLGEVVIGGEAQPIGMARAARNMTLSGATLNIAPFYIPGVEGGKFIAYQAEGAISARNIAQQLSKSLGINVTTAGREVPELQIEYLSQVGGSPKDVGFKAGFTPIMGGQMTVDLGGDLVRVHQTSSEVKSLPMAFMSNFGMQSSAMQAQMAARLSGQVGQDLSSFILSRYQNGQMTDLNEITREYSRLKTGSESELNWLNFSEALLGTFAGDKNKLETLQKFGVAYVDTPQWIYGNTVSQSEMMEFQSSQRAMLANTLSEGRTVRAGAQTFRSLDSLDAAYNALFRFTPVQTAKNQTAYKFDYFVNQGLLTALGTQIAPEMTGWGMLNYRQIASLSQQYPELAQRMGLTVGSPSVTGASSPAKQAWARVKMWETYDMEARARTGFVTPDPSDALRISSEDAARVYAAYRDGVETDFASMPEIEDANRRERLERSAKLVSPLNELNDADRMTRANAALASVFGARYDPNKMLLYSGMKAFLPGVNTMLGIDTYDPATGESNAKVSLSWLSAFERSTLAEASEIPPSQAIGEVANFRKMMSNMLEGKGIAKDVFGFDAPGMTFQRYTELGGLNYGEIYLPQREMQRALGEAVGSNRQAQRLMKSLTGGYSINDLYAASQMNKEQLEGYLLQTYYPQYGQPQVAGRMAKRLDQWATGLMSAQHKLADAFLPGMMFRQPDVSREFGVMASMAITSHQMAARGYSPEIIRALESGWMDAGVSSVFSTIGVGDLDRDPLQHFFALDRSGKPILTADNQRQYAAYKAAQIALGHAMGGTTDTFGALRQVFGNETDAYHIMRSTVAGYLEAMGGDTDHRGDAGALGKGTNGQHLPLEGYLNALKSHTSSKGNMGLVYQAQRLLEASSAALGFTQQAYEQNIFDPLQTFYQKAIDLSLDEKIALVNATNTARVFKKGGEYRFGFSLKGIDDDSMDWADPMRAGNERSGAVALRTVATAFANEGTIRDETLAYMFAPSAQAGASNLQVFGKLRELQSSDPNQWGKVTRASVLMGDVQLPGMAKGVVSEASPYYTALMAQGINRTLTGDPEKYAEYINGQNEISLPWRGGLRTLSQIYNDPYIYLTNMMFGYQTQRGTSNRAMDLVHGIARMRETLGVRSDGSSEPLTETALRAMPSAMQSLAASMKLQLGDEVFNRIATSPTPDLEEKLVQYAVRKSEIAFTSAMDKNLAGAPVVWAGDLAAYIGGNKYNAKEKIVGGMLGMRNASGPEGAGHDFLRDIYPFEGPTGAQGVAFEAGWKQNLPGAPNARFQHASQKLSLKFDYQGGDTEHRGNLRAKPDWLSWDPDTGTLGLIEHKMVQGKDQAYYGQVQAAINAVGMTTMANGTPEQQTSLREWIAFNNRDAQGNVALAPDEDIFNAIQGGNIQTYLVRAATGNNPASNAFAYEAPEQGDWREIQRTQIAPAIQEIAQVPKNRPMLRAWAAPLLNAAQMRGVDVSPWRSYLGEAQPVGGDALSRRAATPPRGNARVHVNVPQPQPQSGGAGAPPIIPPIPPVPPTRSEGGGNGGFSFEQMKQFFESMTVHATIQGGARGNPDKARVEAEAALRLVNALSEGTGQAGFQTLQTRIGAAVAPVLGIDTLGSDQIPMGNIGLAVASAYAANPAMTEKALRPLFGEIRKYGTAYRKVAGVAKSRDQLRNLGINTEDPSMAAGVDAILGNEVNGDIGPIGEMLQNVYGVSSFLGAAGIHTAAPKETTPLPGNAVQVGAANLEKFSEAMRSLNKELEKGIRNTESVADLERQKNVTKEQNDIIDVGARMSTALGESRQPATVEQAAAVRQRLGVKLGELAAREARGELSPEEQMFGVNLRGLGEEYETATFNEAKAGAIRRYQKSEAGIGGMARRALGGFGLMYIGSMLGAIQDTAGYGYQQTLNLRGQANAGIGSVLGAGQVAITPDELIARRIAVYGGGGAAAEKRLMAGALQSAPGLVGALEMGKAGATGFALSMWLSSIASGGLASGLAAAAPYVAVGAAAYSGVSQAVGAAANPEQTAVGIATRIRQGQYDTARSRTMGALFGEPIALGTQTERDFLNKPSLVNMTKAAWARIGQTLDFSTGTIPFYLSKSVREETAAQVDFEKSADAGRLYTDLASGGELPKRLAGYAQALSQQMGAPVETMGQLLGLEARYGFNLSKTKGGAFDIASGQMAQGVPLVETARRMAAATGMGIAGQTAAFGDLFSNLVGKSPAWIEQMQSGAERWAGLGPLAEMSSRSTPESVYAYYGRLNERAYGIVKGWYSYQEQATALGLPFGELPDIPEAMGRKQYVDWTKTIQKKQDWLQTAGGGAFASQLSSRIGLGMAGAGEIGRRYGLDASAEISAYSNAADLYTAYSGNPTMPYNLSVSLGDMSRRYGAPALNAVTQGMLAPLMAYGMTPGAMGGAMQGLMGAYGGMNAPRIEMFSQFLNPMLSAGLAPNTAAQVMASLSSKFSGLSNQQVGLAYQIASGDLGARSWASWNQPDVLKSLNMSDASSRFYDRSMNPILQTNGTAYKALMSAWGVSANIPIGLSAGLSSAFDAGGLRQAQIWTQTQQNNNQWAAYGLQQQNLNLDLSYIAATRPLDAQLRGLSYANQIRNFDYQGARLNRSNDYSIAQENLTQQRMTLSNAYSEMQEGMSWTRMQQNQAYSANIENINYQKMALSFGQADQMSAIQQQSKSLSQQKQTWSLGFNQDTALLQRSWTREDYQYQDQMRNLNFQWQEEDLNEAIRYSHGRQRKQLIKQKDRMELSQGIEDTQIEKGRDRQSELWKRQDEQYEKEKQFLEKSIELENKSFDLQESNRKKLQQLDLEAFELSKAHRIESDALDEQQFELSKTQRMELYKLDQDQFELSQKQREDSFAVEQEQLQKSLEAYQEQYKIEGELIDLRNKNQDAQLAIQQKQLALQGENIKLQQDYEKLVRDTTNAFSDLAAKQESLARFAPAAYLIKNLADALATAQGSASFVYALIDLIHTAMASAGSTTTSGGIGDPPPADWELNLG